MPRLKGHFITHSAPGPLRWTVFGLQVWLAIFLAWVTIALPGSVLAQSSSAGAALWVSKGCSNSNCHGATPSGARANAALPDLDVTNVSRAKGVLNNAITNSGSMSQYANGGSQDLIGTEKESLLLYLESVFDTDPRSTSTSFNTAKNIDLGDDVSLSGNVAGITTLVTGSNPATHGTVAYSNSLKRITYTPSNGWVGNDTFTYRARNSDDTFSTAERSVTVTTNPPPVPEITSVNAVNAKVGDFFSYTIVATNSPTSYSHTSLPPGLGRSGNVISGTPTTFDTSHTATITAGNAGGDDTENLVFNVARGDPVFTLPNQVPGNQPFKPGTTFMIDPSDQATSESPASITYMVSPSSNCTLSGFTVTKVSTGNCTITASQGSSTNWNAPSPSSRSKIVVIDPAIQSLSFPPQTPPTQVFVDGGTFPIDAATSNPPTSSGNAITYGSTDANICTVMGTNVIMQDSGTCTLTANQAGNADYAAAAQVTQNVTLTAGEPAPPTVTSVIGGDTRATIIFTPPANPGSPVTSYTGTCTLGGTQPHTGTSPNNPVIVTGLTNGAPWTCSVTATNAIGTSIVSNTMAAIPSPTATAAAPVFRSTTTATFTIGTFKQFRIATTGVPNATPTSPSPLPSGLSAISLLAGTRLVTGTPAAGTAGTYTFSLSATNASGTTFQTNFRIVIVKVPQTISFPAIADRTFVPSPSTFNLNATASSNLGVSYTSQTMGTCTVSGSAVTMVAAGACTILASQSGDGTWAAATNVPQSFDITPGAQTISWGTLPNKTFVANGTFPLSPLASASSNLAITAYTSLLPGNCTVSGTTVTMLQVGACNIEASQDGNANYLAAADFIRGFAISKARQTIVFPAQAAQPFVEGGTFGINPFAIGGLSGNPIVYSSLSPAVCNVSDSTVIISTPGTCTVAANQAGNNNYLAATQVSVPITINISPPGAPTAGTATPADQSASIAFSPPGTDGGSALIDYRVTCNPGGSTATAAGSPIRVQGLVNNVVHTCTVAVQNAAGYGVESNPINVTPVLRSGQTLWSTTCSGCHGDPPGGTRFNAAGDTSTVLLHVRATVPEMLALSAVQALTSNELAEIAKYIKQQLPAISADTPYQTAVQIDVGFPNHITLSGISFTAVQSVTPPTNGVLTLFSGTTVTYTPNAGFAGTDTFTYRGFRTGPTVQGEPRIVTVNVLIPGAPPVITSAATANGVFGQLFNYQITATNGPASFGASNLPPGVNVNTLNGAISGTPTQGSVFNATITASNPNPSSPGAAGLTITISAANQTITFGAQGNQTFVPGGMFGVSPLATATSNLTPTYSSLTTGVCTVSGTLVTMANGGTCTVAADQSGNGNYNAALQVTRDITINPGLPGAPTIGAATPGNGQATIAFTPPANNGGSPITGYNASCTPTGAGSNTISPITITGLTNNQQYLCSVTATNAAGFTGSVSATVMVTPTATAVAPAITSVNATTFTALVAGTFTVTATGTPNPAIALTSGALPGGVTFNAGVLAGTPASGTAAGSPYLLTFTASSTTMPDAMQSFTLTVAKANQTITFANPGARNFSATPFTITPAPVSTSGLSVMLTSNTPGVCTVSGNDVTTLATGVCSISANVPATADVNAANTVTNGFSISPATQTITFGAQTTTPRNFSTTPFALSPVAFATSALSIAYSTTTPTVCVMSGNNVNTLTAGLCTVAANQAGNANYAAAPQVTQSVTVNAIAPGAPSIGVATGSDMQVSIGFTPPASNGGSPITAYNATCSPSGTGSGAASPVVVSGLTNGTPYTCAVKAANVPAGEGPTSGTVMVTPTSANGATLWTAVCVACHTQVPAGNQLNGAGSTAAVLNFVRANQTGMMFNTNVQALSQAELAAIAAYIGNVVPVNEVTTAFNTATPINVASHLKFTGQAWSAFTEAELVTPPANGIVSAFTGTTATYTPNAGFTGADTFTYRGKRISPNVIGDPRTVTITVQGAVPAITSAATLNGTFGQAVNYQIVATNSPTSFGAANLPAALLVDTGSGVITGLPSAAGMFNITVSATNASGTGNAPLTIAIAQASQTITFGAQTSPRAFSVGGNFVIAPLATGGASGNSLAYSSTTPGVCTLSGTTVNIVSAGLCTLAANQDGNANYNDAIQVTQNVTITPIAPAAPTLDDAIAGNAQATINFTSPANNGGSAITNYTATCGVISANGATSPITVTGLTNGATVTCTVTATGPGGTSVASNGVMVTPVAITVPGAPTIGAAIPGNTQATIAFTPPASNGGSAIINYTATCNPGNVTGSNGASPITVSSLVNGTSYTCSVTATNSIGEGAPSATVNVTPGTALALVGVVSRKTHGATGNFDLVVNAALSITDAITTEPRTIGAGHTLVFQFSGPVSVTGSVAAVDSSALSVGTVSAVASGNDVVVTLTGVPDNKRVTVLLTNVNAVGLDASASVGFLVGDVNGTGSVNSSDISGVKARSGQTTTAVNFKFDVNATGAINASDISAVKARSGLVLAP